MKPRASFGWGLLFLLGLSCSPAPSQRPLDLDPVQAQQWLSQKDAPLLVDVRNPDEYAQERLANSQLVPLPDLDKRWPELPKNRPILLYCHAGKRSQKALDLLREKGFKDLHQIAGGITAWKEQRLPVLSESVPNHTLHP